MEKILIKKQGTNMEIEISQGTTARTILDGMGIYIKTISDMTGVPVLTIIEDLKTAISKEKSEENGL